MKPSPETTERGTTGDPIGARKDHAHRGHLQDVSPHVDPRHDARELHPALGEVEEADGGGVEHLLPGGQGARPIEGDLAHPLDELRRASVHDANAAVLDAHVAVPHPVRHEDDDVGVRGEVDEAPGPDVVANGIAPPGHVDVALAVGLEDAETGGVEPFGAELEHLGGGHDPFGANDAPK